MMNKIKNLMNKFKNVMNSLKKFKIFWKRLNTLVEDLEDYQKI